MYKTCIACGMPMKATDDFARHDPGSAYCVHCARPDGSMQSYDEKLRLMSRHIVRTKGLDQDTARETARSLMARLPAWRDHD